MINRYANMIFRKHYTLEMDAKIQNMYRLRVGGALMKCQNLQKRIQGIKYINEAIRHVR